MAAEIYGMIPSAKTENRPSAPPENMLNMSTIVPRCRSINCSSASGLIPGTGMNVPKRNTARAARTNNSRLRSSVIRPMLPSMPATWEALEAITRPCRRPLRSR